MNQQGVCPICEGTGWINWEDENGYLYAKPCECELKRRSMDRLKKSGLLDVTDRTFDAFTVKEPWQERLCRSAKQYLNTPGHQWFFVGGQPGTGKTHICTAICLELINRGAAVQYMRWREDTPSLKATLNTEDHEREIKKYLLADVLYIDDLFKGNVTEGDKNLAMRIIDHRYANKLCTIISSEMQSGEITTVDEAIGSRICERCKGYLHNIARIDGRNQRLTRGDS